MDAGIRFLILSGEGEKYAFPIARLLKIKENLVLLLNEHGLLPC